MADVIEYVIQLMFRASGFAAVVFVTLLSADSFLIKEKTEYYSKLPKANFVSAKQSLHIVDIFYGLDRVAKVFFRSIFFITAIGLIGAIFQ